MEQPRQPQQTALPTGRAPQAQERRPVQRPTNDQRPQQSVALHPNSQQLVPRHTLPATPPPVFDQITEAQTFLDQVRERAYVLSPVVKLDHLPEFYSLSVRFIAVDPRKEQGEVYEIYDRDNPGMVALSKVALDKVAAAAGISWHPTLSCRLDDRSEPYYCHFRAVGVYRDTDGQMRMISGEKETDARDGNPLIWKPQGGGYQRGWSDMRVQMVREHILPLTESKARNRVVRLLGVRQKYPAAELAQKPFVVLALVLTGRSSDPKMQEEAKRRILERELNATAALFGPEAAGSTPQLPAPEPAENTELPHPPPPAGTARARDDDEDADTVADDPNAAPCVCTGEYHEPGCPGNRPSQAGY